MSIVIVGTMPEGFRFFGPFEDHDEAAEWADTINDVTWIATLEEPV